MQLINKNGETEEEFFKKYALEKDKYEKPSVTVDMLIFTIDEKENNNYRKLNDKELKILLIQRADHPYIGQWAIPGGFVNVNESIDDAAERELYEETHVEDVYLEQLFTWGEVERDPRMRVISISYLALVDKKSLDVKAGDDAADAKWFSIKYNLLKANITKTEKGYVYEELLELNLVNGDISLNATVQNITTVTGKKKRYSYKIISNKGIAFDHAPIVLYAIDRLKNKIEYTDIAFNLMSELFTLKELEQVYSVILNKPILNFRRMVKNMVVETDKIRENAGHRPAKLFRFNQYHNLNAQE